MTTSRTRALVLLVVAFTVGTIVGGVALTGAVRAGKADFVIRGGRGPGSGGPGRGYDWVRRLELADSVRDSVMAVARTGECALDSIVRTRIGAQMDSLWESVRTDIETRRAQTRSETRALLSPPQQVRYDSMTKAADENRRRMREMPMNRCTGATAGRGGGPRGSR
ncbi:MAG: hypothetical protein SFU84_10760 [Gemmatimonadales bacterium]|nr:hypothetical protein [Gemmatimonadales bacterium]